MNVKRITPVVRMQLASTQLAVIIVSVIMDLDWNLASPTSLGLVSNVKVRAITPQEYFLLFMIYYVCKKFVLKRTVKIYVLIFGSVLLFFLHHMYESVSRHFVMNVLAGRGTYVFPLGQTDKHLSTYLHLFPFQICAQLTKLFAEMEPATLELMVIRVNATKGSQTIVTKGPNA